MTKNNSEEPYLRLRDIFNENLFRDIILFSLLFLFILAQQWNNIFFLLFPIITFAFSFFFRIISSNKWRIRFERSPIIYNPLGQEKKNANRFTFSALLQLIILFWIGAESLYHPQLIDDYNFYFNILFVFVYSFGFYWIFSDIWKYTKMEIDLQDEEFKKSLKNDLNSQNKIERVISYLKPKNLKRISIINLLLFIIFNIINVIFAFLIHSNLFSGFPYDLPGTGIEFSNPLEITPVIFLIFGISPTFTIIFLILIYKDIHKFKHEDLYKVIRDLPENIQDLIINNLKNLNKKLNRALSIE